MEWPDNESAGFPTPATQDDTTSAATSGAPETPQGSTGRDTPAPVSGSAEAQGPQGEGAIPKYRFDEVNQRYQSVAAQNAHLQAQMANLVQIVQRLSAGQPGAGAQAPEAPQLDERQQKIIEQLDKLLPHSPLWKKLQPIIDRFDEIAAATDHVKQSTAQEKQHWQGLAARTMGNVLTEAATTFLGAGKTPEDFTPYQHRMVREAFATWAQLDDQRVERYERMDPSLVKDFIAEYRQLWGGSTPPKPVVDQRQQAAAAQRRAEAVRRLPTSGAPSAPVGSAPPTLNPQDEDAVHSAGWQFVQAALNASR